MSPVHTPSTPRSCVIFHNKLNSSPNPQTDDHPLSIVRDCLFNIFAATLRIWKPSPPSATRGRPMPWWQGPTQYGRCTRTHTNWIHCEDLAAQPLLWRHKISFCRWCGRNPAQYFTSYKFWTTEVVVKFRWMVLPFSYFPLILSFGIVKRYI
jgi:hypothetical protein